MEIPYHAISFQMGSEMKQQMQCISFALHILLIQKYKIYIEAKGIPYKRTKRKATSSLFSTGWSQWQTWASITKTRLYNFDPLKSLFYILNRGLQGYTLFFLIPAWKHRLWVLVRTASSRQDLTSIFCIVLQRLNLELRIHAYSNI